MHVLPIAAFVLAGLNVFSPSLQEPENAPPQTERIQAEPVLAAAAQNLLSSIAVIGASVSCGAGNARELEVRRDVPLGVFLKGALEEEQAKASKFLDLGDTFFFANPDVNASVQVSKANEFEPTLVVALDFLFWFAYGEPSRKSPRRAEGLERGLKLLERFECPMVIGDLPDIDHALAGVGPFGGPIVHPGMFPKTVERLAMNRRLSKWAKERGNVTVIPLDGLITKMIGGKPIELRGNSWTVKSLPDALQKDRLHPTVRGSVWTALHVADAITGLDESVAQRFTWDVERTRERVTVLTKEKRAAKLGADKRRATRRKKTEERRKEREKAGK